MHTCGKAIFATVPLVLVLGLLPSSARAGCVQTCEVDNVDAKLSPALSCLTLTSRVSDCTCEVSVSVANQCAHPINADKWTAPECPTPLPLTASPAERAACTYIDVGKTVDLGFAVGKDHQDEVFEQHATLTYEGQPYTLTIRSRLTAYDNSGACTISPDESQASVANASWLIVLLLSVPLRATTKSKSGT